jgi:hypothetical protein
MCSEYPASRHQREPWNKGRLVGQKRPLKPKDVWTIRVRPASSRAGFSGLSSSLLDFNP